MDVGAGANLYPALLMLPWAEHIVFTEYAASSNFHWLSENLADAPGEWHWQPFWDLVAGLPGYRAVEQPRRRLAAVHEIRTPQHLRPAPAHLGPRQHVLRRGRHER